MAAKNGQISLTLNESFHKTLINYGVISGREGSSATIKIYPVYQQENVEIHFENADRNDANASEKAKYDASHLASYIDNVVQASGQSGSGVSKQKHDGWLDYYKMIVPKNSVIRVKSVPAANRTANGVVWWAFGSNTMNRVYYERGQNIVDPLYASGQTVAATDYAMADVIASQNLCIKPNTGNQTLYIGYSPRSLNWAKNAFGNGLQGAIVDVTDGAPDSMNYGVNASDADGALTRNALLGGQYAMLVNAPQGYYASWADMTGDNDNNGAIEQKELTAQSNKSKNPRYVYGNRLFVKPDQDSTRYYYQFLPVTNTGIVHATGRALRQNNTLLRLANNQQPMGTVPIAGAYVNVAGFTAQTSADGSYDVELKGGLSDWGNVSVQLTPPDGASYAQVRAIERVSDITLDALERFTAKSVKAAYNSAAGVTATAIAVQDDTLTITTEVYDSAAVQATKAHFSFYNRNGIKAFDCDGRDGYETTLERKGNYLRATLTFNPKKEVQRNYRLYVSFEDQTGARYAPIDVGYQFTTGLTLKEFLFPMLGSSSLEGAYNDVTSAIDILGDPLSNLDLGALPGMSEKATDYQPVADDDRVSWMNYDYTFGWSKEFSKDMEISLSDTVQGDEQMNSIMKDLQSGNAGGADAVGGGFEASASFNFSITPSMGFRLRVSLRDLYDESGKRLESRSGTFFEDLIFYFRVKWGVASTISIATPVGINILIDLGADGDIAGVYHMYMDYTDDDYHNEYKLPFDSENFGIFKKFSNDRVRREGYLFANPAVTIGVGAEYCGISVTCDAHFNFDTDFRFTAKGVDAYGDLTYNLTWSFKAFGFTLYSLTLPDGLNKYNVDTKFNTIPIFHTDGVSGHINFDYEVEPTLTAALSDALRNAPAQSLKDSRPTSRAYLDNRSAWRQPDESVTLLDAQGSTESELRKGAAEDLKIQLTPIGKNGDLLMVFADDVPDRTDVNKRAVYYSVYTASDERWSEPAVIYDDGTADDYPAAQDLGDGRIFVAWSSVETAMGDGATLEETLQATNIQAAFFDTASRKFGPAENLTRTTDANNTADLMPHAAYDPDSKRLILYYTKTQYEHLDDPADMGNAFSLIAYLFYENGVWSNTGDAYTEEELSYFENPEEYNPEEYKENWYGQRFLETRLDLSSDVTPRVAESSAIGYNGLALFSYVADWDDDLTTANDRDIFLQIYNFSEDSFSHIIRITEESGAYSLPTLVRSDNGTYLFYGEKGQAKESGCIRYLNVSYVIQNGLYEKITQGDNEYYVLRATRSAVTTDSPDGEGMSLPAETVAITADKAVDCGSLSDFDAFVSSDGRTYLLWTALNPETDASDIYAFILNSEDESLNEAENGAESQAAWSDAALLTDGGPGAYYSNLDVIGSKNGMMIVSGKGQFMDASANSMVQIKHTPYGKLTLDDEITVENPYAAAGDNVNVTATLRNAGWIRSRPTRTESAQFSA